MRPRSLPPDLARIEHAADLLNGRPALHRAFIGARLLRSLMNQAFRAEGALMPNRAAGQGKEARQPERATGEDLMTVIVASTLTLKPGGVPGVLGAARQCESHARTLRCEQCPPHGLDRRAPGGALAVSMEFDDYASHGQFTDAMLPIRTVWRCYPGSVLTKVPSCRTNKRSGASSTADPACPTDGVVPGLAQAQLTGEGLGDERTAFVGAVTTNGRPNPGAPGRTAGTTPSLSMPTAVRCSDHSTRASRSDTASAMWSRAPRDPASPAVASMTRNCPRSD